MGNNITKKSVNGFLWLGGFRILSAIFQFLVLAVLARLLTPLEFGLMSLALVIIQFAEIFNDMGFGPAITQKSELSSTDIKVGFTYSILFGVLVCLIIQLISPSLSRFFDNQNLIPILRVVSIVVILNAISSIPLGLMYRDLKYKQMSLINICSYVLVYAPLVILFAFYGYGVWSLVFGVLAQSFITLVYLLYKNFDKIGISFNKDSLKTLLSFGGGYSLSKIFSYAVNKGDKLLVGRLLGLGNLGLYERGYQLVKYTTNILGEVIDKVLFSPIARKQKEKEAVSKMFLELTYIFSILFIPFSIFMYLNASFIVSIVLGDQWKSTIDIAKIMSISIFFLITTRLSSTIAKSLGDVYNRAWRTLAYAIFNLIGVYIGSFWGIQGAALAVSLGAMLNYILAFNQINKLVYTKYIEFYKSHFLGLILGVFYLVLYLVGHYFLRAELYSNLINLSIGLAILFFVYLLILVFDKAIVLKYKTLLFKNNI